MVCVTFADFAETAVAVFAVAVVRVVEPVSDSVLHLALVRCHLRPRSEAAPFPLPHPLLFLALQGQPEAGVVGVRGFLTVLVVLLALY